MLEELAALAALEIGVEDEGTVLDPLEQHDTGGRPAISGDGGKRERRRLGQAVAADSRGVVEQPPESRNRVGGGLWHRAKCTRGHAQRTPAPDRGIRGGRANGEAEPVSAAATRPASRRPASPPS